MIVDTEIKWVRGITRSLNKLTIATGCFFIFCCLADNFQCDYVATFPCSGGFVVSSFSPGLLQSTFQKRDHTLHHHFLGSRTVFLFYINLFFMIKMKNTYTQNLNYWISTCNARAFFKKLLVGGQWRVWWTSPRKFFCLSSFGPRYDKR